MRRKGRGFAENVFDDGKMKRYLPKSTYEAIVAAREGAGEPTERDRNRYAKALMKWARKLGVTRYTHWFQPLNDFTAGKRDSIYSIDKLGRAYVKFRGKELSCGEGDASSFPNGGMRETFEARGVTHLDYTSYAFVIEDCLFIPTTFTSFNGEVLDKKTPLIRSSIALNKEAMRVLNAIGDKAKHVWSVVGAEQEYFLIDNAYFERRRDLIYCGRTLFGAKPPKGQEFNDHYYRKPSGRVAKFMQDLDAELWKLGIVAKTEHNEVAPHQFELAPCYARVNLACDYNQLTMEMLNGVAKKHGFTCLLHEKPFRYVNGSGKHNNWSILTDTDENLLEMGETAHQNARFMLFLAAVIAAVDEYSELLTASICNHGNDCRLGGYEAPPQILTVFLGEPLSNTIKEICSHKWQAGKDTLPKISTGADRNRTSPFAFTGNKFEFRMVGSSASISDVNTALNVAVAEILRQFADELEHSGDVWQTVTRLVVETFTKHKRIIFDGNNYGEKWLAEAKRRKLKSVDTLSAIENTTNAHNVNLLERHGVLTHREALARQQILLQNYANTLHIEGQVAQEMYIKQIAPSVTQYLHILTKIAKDKNDLGVDCEEEKRQIEQITKLLQRGTKIRKKLTVCLKKSEEISQLVIKTQYMHANILPAIEALRLTADVMEQLCPAHLWSMPTYSEMLFQE
ncbi:MAG: glutamine synthetase III [Clostridiales bacterium]|nr:glutamine synthetase III [Clostridiales bacterium]